LTELGALGVDLDRVADAAPQPQIPSISATISAGQPGRRDRMGAVQQLSGCRTQVCERWSFDLLALDRAQAIRTCGQQGRGQRAGQATFALQAGAHGLEDGKRHRAQVLQTLVRVLTNVEIDLGDPVEADH